MNSFDIVYNELNKDGMSVEVMRKSKDGVMQKADMREMATLGTKSRVASTAGLLRNLSREEKLQWALETKNEANELYAERKYAEAMEKYVECLAGADFGSREAGQLNGANDRSNEHDQVIELGNDDDQSSHSGQDNRCSAREGNIDTLVIPVLCNLSACCLQQQEWHKAASFAEQALLLQPQCCKALFRKGLSLLNVGEYDDSLHCFRSLQKRIDASAASADAAPGGARAEGINVSGAGGAVDLNASELERLPKLMLRARQGAKQQKMYRLKQKATLQEAFRRNSQQTSPTVTTVAASGAQHPKISGSNSDTKQSADSGTDSGEELQGNVQGKDIAGFFYFLLSCVLQFFTRLFNSKDTKVS